MRREVIAVLGVKLAPNEAPGPVDVNNHTVQTWLEKRYAERVGKAEYATLRARYKAQGGGNAVTDNVVVERLGRLFSVRDTGPASALHTELLDQLTQKIAIDDAALIQLAQARAQAMRDSLVQYGLAGARISLAAPARLAVKDKQVDSKLVLGAGGVAAPETAAPAQPATSASPPAEPAQAK